MQLRAIAANPVPEFSPVITGSRQLARVRKRTVSPSVWIVWLRRCLRHQSGSVMHMPVTAGTQLMPISRR